MTSDTCVTIVPYFKIKSGQLDAFKAHCQKFVARTETEPKALYYGFSFNGDEAHCREGYVDAEGLLHHLQNVGDLIAENDAFADTVRLEVHGPAAELAKVRAALPDLPAQWFTLEVGFRK